MKSMTNKQPFPLVKPPIVSGLPSIADVGDDRKSSNFVRNGRVYILGDFDDTISRYVVPDFNDLISDSVGQKDATIPIYINSFGGEADKLQSLLSLIAMAKSVGIGIMTLTLDAHILVRPVLQLWEM